MIMEYLGAVHHIPVRERYSEQSSPLEYRKRITVVPLPAYISSGRIRVFLGQLIERIGATETQKARLDILEI
jgi:hypothetical protein